MRYLRFWRRDTEDGTTHALDFASEHFIEAGLRPMSSGGMTVLEAHELMNKWNRSQYNGQRYTYFL